MADLDLPVLVDLEVQGVRARFDPCRDAGFVRVAQLLGKKEVVLPAPESVKRSPACFRAGRTGAAFFVEGSPEDGSVSGPGPVAVLGVTGSSAVRPTLCDPMITPSPAKSVDAM